MIHITYSEALMNISGPPVAKAVRNTGVDAASLVGIHDSLEHKPAAVSPSFGTSHRGTNGVRSIIDSLGTKDFHRIRIGIGRGSGDVADYVLGRLSSFEKQQYGPDTEVLDAIERHLASIAGAR